PGARRETQHQQDMRGYLSWILSGRLKAQAEADWRSMMVARANGRVLLHDWYTHDIAAQRTWLEGLLTERTESVAPFLRAFNEDVTEVRFWANKDLIHTMTDMERLIAAANRAVYGAGEAQDVKVIRFFLAWAKEHSNDGSAAAPAS